VGAGPSFIVLRWCPHDSAAPARCIRVRGAIDEVPTLAAAAVYCVRVVLGLVVLFQSTNNIFLSTFPIVQSPEICLCFRRCLLHWMEFAICALWVRSFLSGPGTGGRIRYYPTDREPNSETVRIPRSPRIKRYRAFWSSSRWRLFCPSPWFSPSRLVGVPSSMIRRLAASP